MSHQHAQARRTSLVLAIIVLVVVVLAGIVYALFSQNTPSITPPASPSLTGPCSSLVQEGALAPVTGVARLDCGSLGSAFSVNVASSFTPTFTLPTVATGTVGPLQVAPSGQCTSGLLSLTSGSPEALLAGSYDYCLGYANFPSSGGESIPSFSISWS